MSMDELKKQLKESRIGKLYLLTGPEKYLARYYEKEIVKQVVEEPSKILNFTLFEGKVSMNEIADAVSQYPAFSDRRVVVIRESNLSKAGSKEHAWNEFFESLPEYICLVFVQEEMDKRTSFYKNVKKYGLIAECLRQDEAALAKWAMKVFASYKKQIDDKTAAFLIGLLEPDMSFIRLEIEKVVSYLGEQSRVTQEAVLDVVSKSVKSRIFDLTDVISQNQSAKALQIADELIQQKEPVPYIMAMLSRQMSILMKVKRMEEGKFPPAEMVKILGVPPFVVGKIRKQASFFSKERLKQLIRKCMELDLAVKTGMMDGRMAMDLFIVSLGLK